MRERTMLDIYGDFSCKGEFRNIILDFDVIKKIYSLAIEDQKYIEYLLKQEIVNYRIIYTLYYDVLRSLCGVLSRIKA